MLGKHWATIVTLPGFRIAFAVFVGCVVSFGIAACAATTNENVSATATVAGGETALAPLVTPSPNVSGDSSLATAGASAPANEEGGQLAPAGSIDLREIAPPADPGREEGFVELPAPGSPDLLARSVHLAREDLSAHLQSDIEETAFVEAEEVVWSDRSLGCPKANTGYLAEETPGFKITLAAGGERYTYHTDLGQNVVLCLDGEPAPLRE